MDKKFARNLNGVKDPQSDAKHAEIVARVEARLGSAIVVGYAPKAALQLEAPKVEVKVEPRKSENIRHIEAVFLDDIVETNMYDLAFQDAMALLKTHNLTA